MRGSSDPSSLRGSEGGARGLDDNSPVQVNNEKRRTAFSTKADLLGSSLETMHYPLPEQIGQESCIPEEACTDFGDGKTSERIGDDSCTGPSACEQTGCDVRGFLGVGDHSCKGDRACQYSWSNAIGDNSCHGDFSCVFNWDGIYHSGTGNIGQGSCHGNASCENVIGEVGDNSCHGDRACNGHDGDIPSNCPRINESGGCEYDYVCDNWLSSSKGYMCEGSTESFEVASYLSAAACRDFCMTKGPGCCESAAFWSGGAGSCWWYPNADSTGYHNRHYSHKAVFCRNLGAAVESGELGQLATEG